MASGKRILSLTITGLLVFLTGFSADMGSALAANEALILLDSPEKVSMIQAIGLIERQGAEILLAYPPHVLIGQVPPAVKDRGIGIDAVVSVHYDPVDTSIGEGYGRLASWGIEYWNSRASAVARPALPGQERKPLPLRAGP